MLLHELLVLSCKWESTVTWNGFRLDSGLEWNKIYLLCGIAVECITFDTVHV